MICLRSTDTVRVTTTSANALDVTATFHDSNSTTFSPDRELHQISSATTTTIVAAPSSGLVRSVKELTFNARGGSNTVTIDVFDGSLAYRRIKCTLGADDSLIYEDAEGWVVVTGGARKSLGITTGVDVQTFKVAGTYTWTKPSNAKRLDVHVYPVGGPGGSGRRISATGTAAGGGASGTNAVPIIVRGIDAAAVGATETVVIGADSVGGAAQTVDNTNGNSGTAGGTTSFGSLVSAPAASAGNGGTTAGGTAGTSSSGFVDDLPLNGAGNAGSNGSANGTSGVNTAAKTPTTGGAGGGINAAGTARDGGSGGNNAFATGGTAGTAAGTRNGGNGNSPSPSGDNPLGGTGGGGGAANNAGAGGDGGDGGFPSASGGGGGASVGANSGKGGKGGGALVIVITHCG